MWRSGPLPLSPRVAGMRTHGYTSAVVFLGTQLVPVLEYLMRATGFHEFAEFTTGAGVGDVKACTLFAEFTVAAVDEE